MQKKPRKPRMPKKIRIANERRANLIYKKVYSTLTDAEKEEYAQVDKLVGDWINEHFPFIPNPKLEKIERRLKKDNK